MKAPGPVRDRLWGVILAAGKGTRMGSDLPKVLLDLEGEPLLEHALRHLWSAGVERVVAVAGHRYKAVQARLAERQVDVVVQEPQRGTGHAVQQALPLLGDAEEVVVCYGDMPLLRPETLRRLVERRREAQAAAAILTAAFDEPPDYGRVLRDAAGRVERVVEVRDCTPQQRSVREVNVGAYCFSADALRRTLPLLSDDNAQGELYLTDVVGLLTGSGHRVEAVVTDDPGETLGVNTPEDLEKARAALACRS